MLRRLLALLSTPSSAAPAASGSASAVPTPFPWRKFFLVCATVLVCLYAASVLYFARSIPDIGLHTAFSCGVNRVNPSQVRPNTGSRGPEKKDVIVGLGDRPIDSWPKLMRELEEIG